MNYSGFGDRFCELGFKYSGFGFGFRFRDLYGGGSGASFVLFCFSGAVFPSVFHQLSISWYFTMASRLLIGDNNLSKFWPACQFGRPSLKGLTLVVATDLDTLDNALAQAEDREQVPTSF